MDLQTHSNTNNFEIRLETFGSGNRVKRGHTYGPVLTSSYLLQYCSEGCGEIEIDGNIFPVKAGECFVTLPNQIRTERADTKDPWAHAWIGVNGQSAATFFDQIGITASNPIIKDCANSRIPQRLQKIIEVANQPECQPNFILAESLFAFMKEFIKFRNISPQNNQTLTNKYIEQAIYYMNMHYFKSDINIQTLADSMGLNRSYFYEIFKSKTGMSPKQYLTQLRIQKACEYLLMPQATITSVAYSVGYEPSTFSRAFRSVMGINPSDYRNEH